MCALLQIPVYSDDDHCCRPCMRKFIAAEVFVLASKSSYESRGRECLLNAQGARKRGKNSSGPDVS